MKQLAFISALLLSCSLSAQTPKANYDESKVPDFILPELLTCNNGKKVTTARQWEKERRPELMKIFAENQFGITPVDQKIKTEFVVVEESDDAYRGKAIRRQVNIVLSKGDDKREILMLLYLPRSAKEKKAPVFVGLNFQGNQTVCDDPEVIPSEAWCRGNDEYKVTNNTNQYPRGVQANRWCVEKLIDAGYGVATACYNDIYPDDLSQVGASILPLFSEYPAQSSSPTAWQAIGAWAWGLSRMMDCLEIDKQVDATRIAVIGHSRLGKAALWAGAQDKRFKMVISNDSGCGGAALSKREFGETVERITTVFPHWFCPRYSYWGTHIKEMPFDQHGLLALIAPRALYVASAEEDLWADPKGEYLSAHFTTPVYALYGLKGLENPQPPAVNQPMMNTVGYHIRSGKHDVTPYDWNQYIIFANKNLK